MALMKASLLTALVACASAFVPPAPLNTRANAPSGLRTRGDVAMKAARMPIKPGSMVALVTPFTASGAIDEKVLRELLRWHVEAKSDGILVLGTTAEASVMSTEEKARVLEITAEEVKGKVPIVVGTGTINPETVVKSTKQAVDFGADASLVVTPYYLKTTPKGLIKHFKYVADAVDLPMILYNVPGRTGVDMKPETVAQVADHPGIIGIKEATGDVPRCGKLRELCGKDFMLFSGDDETGAEFTLQGGDGVISVTSNIVPALQAKIMAAALKKDRATTEALNKPLGLLHNRLFCQPNPIPVKWALYRMGKIPIGIRAPLLPLEEEFHAPLEEALKAAGAL